MYEIIFKKEGKPSFWKHHFMYHTKRYTKVNSYTIGFIYKITQLIIIYHIIYVQLWKEKQFQQRDIPSSVVTSELFGVRYQDTNFTSDKFVLKKAQTFADENDLTDLDTTEHAIPPINYNSIFIMTNFIKTDQNQGICDEDENKICYSDSDCIDLFAKDKKWNGRATGRCVASTRSTEFKVCEVLSWCPVEDDSFNVKNNIFKGITEYSILIRNNVEFKEFDKQHQNIPLERAHETPECIYSKYDTLCPVFQIGYILEQAEPNPIERELILEKGASLEIKIEWQCNYDLLLIFHILGSPDGCLPLYSFSRLDVSSEERKAAIGYNFRFANHYYTINKDLYARTLYKAYGIRFIINVVGQAGRFSIVQFFKVIGTGFGLMGLSVFIADMLSLTIKGNKNQDDDMSSDSNFEMMPKDTVRV